MRKRISEGRRTSGDEYPPLLPTGHAIAGCGNTKADLEKVERAAADSYREQRMRYENLSQDERELLHRLFFCRECVPGPEVSLCSLPVCYRREWTAEAAKTLKTGNADADSTSEKQRFAQAYDTAGGYASAASALSATCPKKL